MIRKSIYMLLLLIILGMMSACHESSSENNKELSDKPNPSIEATASSDVKSEDDITIDSAVKADLKYLSLLTIDEGYAIADYAEYEGAENQYKIYEFENIDNKTEYSRDVYWEVVILQGEAVSAVLRQTLDEFAGPVPSASALVLEADVNFDSKNDVLFWLGHFGNQGLIRYACYLSAADGYIECPSFMSIPNPAVDKENKVILSSWRNSAASHSYAMYYLIYGEYIETERLTEALIIDESGNELWTWTDEIFVDGKWHTREYFTENDYDEETLYTKKIYGEESHWDITQDRWRTLYNNGMMSDFSIYSSEYVEED